MIEKIDLEERMSHYSSSDVLLLKKATEHIAEKLNEVIDAVNTSNEQKCLAHHDGLSEHITSNLCNCRRYKRGESAGGWYCPEHGPKY